MENDMKILLFHFRVLRHLLLWPRLSLSNMFNKCIIYGFFSLTLICFIPIIWAVLYQIYVGIDDMNILSEALIAVCDIMGYMMAYICFLKNKTKIENIIKDIGSFLEYSPRSIIQDTDEFCSRYTKYMLIYVSIGLSINVSLPLMTRKYCIAEKIEKGNIFYQRHDPCGMPTHNFYPFDASQPNVFWMVCLAEGIFACHICYVFSMVTATILGLLMQVTSQLKYCGLRFERIYDRYQYKSNKIIRKEFLICVKYHQQIITYVERIFSVFNGVVSLFVMITAFAIAIIGNQIVKADRIQDRLRYTMLVLAWGLLFFLICFHAQKVQDESTSIAMSAYNCNWNMGVDDIDLKRDILMVIRRAQYPLYFKIPYLGVISLSCFVAVMKTAYSCFTLLLAVTDNN